MEDPDTLRVPKKHNGGERMQEVKRQNEERVDTAFEKRLKLKKDNEIRKEIIRSQNLVENQVVIVQTKEGEKEGTIKSFDENSRVWVLLQVSKEEEERGKKDIRLFEPIDVEPKN